MNPVPPEAYAALLIELNRKGITPIIVGGQAVNIWASFYEDWDTAHNPEPSPLRAGRPFTSYDMDLSGVNNDQVSYLPGVVDRQIPRRQFRTLAADAGTFFFQGPGSDTLKFQVLTFVLGADNQEIEERAVPLTFSGADVFLPDPLVMLKCKLANVIKLPQEDRNDLAHVGMMIRCVRAYIGEDVHRGVEARKILKLIDRLDAVRNYPYARLAEAKYGIDLAKCLPIPQLRERAQTDEKIGNYLRYQIGIIRESPI